MNGLFGAAAEVQSVVEGTGAPFCFIGGLALLRWAEPRLTRDVDLVIVTGFGGESPVVDHLLNALSARVPDAREFAARARVVLLQTSSGVGVDVSLVALPFEERAAERATLWDVGDGIQLRTCTAADLIVLKVFAGRPQDWVDVGSLLDRQRTHLNVTAVVDELRPLLEMKDQSADLDRFLDLVDQY